MAWNVVGHELAVGLLGWSIARGRVSHAYLLSGPAQVGKRTLALELARALNCEADDGRWTTGDRASPRPSSLVPRPSSLA